MFVNFLTGPFNAAESTSTMYQQRRSELEVTFTTGVRKIGRVPVAAATNAVNNDDDDDDIVIVVVVVSCPDLTLRDTGPHYASALSSHDYRKIIMQPQIAFPPYICANR